MKWNWEELTKGCTVLSFVFGKLGIPVLGEYCCDEHDVAYDQGGNLWDKIKTDARFFKCVRRSGGSIIAGFRWVMISFNPYSYYAWYRKERGLD